MSRLYPSVEFFFLPLSFYSSGFMLFPQISFQRSASAFLLRYFRQTQSILWINLKCCSEFCLAYIITRFIAYIDYLSFKKGTHSQRIGSYPSGISFIIFMLCLRIGNRLSKLIFSFESCDNSVLAPGYESVLTKILTFSRTSLNYEEQSSIVKNNGRRV